MRDAIRDLVDAAVQSLQAEGVLPSGLPEVQIERARDKAHGDFACTAAMGFAKAARRPPRAIAEAIVGRLAPVSWLAGVDIAGAGFINFRLAPAAWHAVVAEVLAQGAAFGRSQQASGRRVLIEFVSANPTGPLHVGHGRSAAYGASQANLIETQGWTVEREYYINDAGRQMNILAASVWLRYLELCGDAPPFPAAGYQGDYIWDIAATVHREHAERCRRPLSEVLDGLPADAPQGGDADSYIDALIERGRSLLGEPDWAIVFAAARDTLVDDIRDDLSQFGVDYQNWYPESDLVTSGAVVTGVQRLRERGYIYERDGASWFRATDFGDEKDRVVLRDNGQATYFASDIAYHAQKFERGYDLAIDIWGADHHGYVPRVRGALSAMGLDPAKLEVLLIQFANLYRGTERLPMSTRSGQYVTLRELRKEVGRDAARFFYVMRRHDQHLDFDLELAKSRNNDNPVYYVQYAHARSAAVLRQAGERGLDVKPSADQTNLERLASAHEIAVMQRLAQYPEVLATAAANLEPHQLPSYLRELATDFHAWYNAEPFLVDDAPLRDARIKLMLAVRTVIAAGLDLIGVSAPDSM